MGANQERADDQFDTGIEATDEPSSTDQPLVSFVIATYNRKADIEEAIDSILEQEYRPIEVLVVSSSTDGTGTLFEDGGPFDHDCVRYYHFEKRMGCPEARNIGYEQANGDIVITIDDDAVIRDVDATSRVVELFEQNPKLGIIGFKGVNPDGETPYQWVPTRRERMADTPFEATHFVGFGNAIRAEVFDEAGMYPGEFVYSFEEKDLSLQTLDSGYRIRYEPSIVVLHKVSSGGRLADREVTRRGLENRIRVAVRNLPWRYVAATTLFWVLDYVRRSSGNADPLTALQNVFRSGNQLLESRDVVDRTTLDYVRSNDGPLYFWIFL